MGDVEIIGRGIVHDDERCHTTPDIEKLQVFTLSQASSLSDLSIHELKEAIHGKRLVAAWYGRYLITFEDLVRFMEEAQVPLPVPLKLMIHSRP